MRIALVGPELEENLALRYLHAALVNAGHEVLIFDFNSSAATEALAGRILSYAPHLVGLSMVFTGRAREFAALAETLRRFGYPGHVTAGGHFAAFHAEELLTDVPAIDSVVHGEGETAIVDLTNHLSRLDDVAGITFRDAQGRIAHTPPRRNVGELDAIAWPTRTPPFHTYLGLPIANLLGSRGCFGRCNFCSIAAWHKKTGGPAFRQRSARCVAEEMAMLYHEHGVRIFNFHDDNFFLPAEKDNLKRFAALEGELRGRRVGRIALQVKARPDSITEEVVDRLKQLGLFRVFLGVESNAVAGLRTLGRGITREQNHEALRILAAAGIHTTFNLLMFDPETTFGDFDDNTAFLESCARFPLNFGRVEAYAGTPLETRLRDEGRLRGDYWGHSYRIRDPRMELVFQVFKSVFTPRNFDDGAVNLLGMKVDYLFHLLKHFRPDDASARLAQDCGSAIENLNLHSVGLLRIIRDYACGADLSDERARTELAGTLCDERRAFDASIRQRMQTLIEEIESVSSTNRQCIFPLRAAAAAAAIVISVSGCREVDGDKHMCEMMMDPIEEPQPPAKPDDEPDAKPTEPPSSKTGDPPVKIPDDWHMCEMMMSPMDEWAGKWRPAGGAHLRFVALAGATAGLVPVEP